MLSGLGIMVRKEYRLLAEQPGATFQNATNGVYAMFTA
jgi:hypothetical protein